MGYMTDEYGKAITFSQFPRKGLFWKKGPHNIYGSRASRFLCYR